MKHFLFICFLFLISCQRNAAETQKDSSRSSVNNPIIPICRTNPAANNAHSADSIRKALHMNIRLDSLFTVLTKQENVRVLAHLQTEWDAASGMYHYSAGGYSFRLKVTDSKDGTNTILYDGEHAISFEKHFITSADEGAFRGEDFAYNDENTLQDPVILEVCGRKFLYSSVQHMCNGLGCSVNLFLIYDLETHEPVFIENFGIFFDGYYLSDFNNDKIPDILLISKNEDGTVGGFRKQELLLTAYSFKNGSFQPAQDHSDASMILSGIKESDFSDSQPELYCMRSSHWFR